MIETIKKYNFWNGEPVKCGFIRQEYLSRIGNFIGNRLIKVVLGQRRTGKSFLMRMIIDHLIRIDGVLPQNILYINMDIRDFSFINNADKLSLTIAEYRKELNPVGKVYLFVDEIQEIEGWEKYINSLSQDYTAEYEVFITGSNANILSSELSTYLSGRYVSIEIFPFSFSEFLGYYNLPQNKDAYLRYLKKGGLPELLAIKDDLAENYISALKDSIILRDIINRHSIRESVLLKRMVDYLIDSPSTLFSVNKIVNTFKSSGIRTNVETIGEYIRFLCEAYFVHEASRYDISGKKILAGEKKYYLNDLCFKQYLTSGFDKGISRFLENLVFLHFKREGYTIYVGKFGNREIDFVAEKNGIRKYIQVAYLLNGEDVIKREFGNLEAINDNYEKMVISLDDICLGNVNGILHRRAWEL
jgi:predicted AAA+ superfamily ATPase